MLKAHERKKMFKCLMSMCLSLSLCLQYAVTVAAWLPATFRTTPNNSHAQWCGYSEETNETAKMTYFTEAWCRCRYSFHEYISCSFPFFLLHSLTLSLSRSLCLCRCLQVSAHVKPNDYNLLRDYEVSCILYIQFYAVKRCLINYTAVALALAAALIETATKKKLVIG